MRALKGQIFLAAVLFGVLLASGSEPGFGCNLRCEYPSHLTRMESTYTKFEFEPHRAARWTTDGDKLVFGFNNGLYSVDSDGSNLRKLFSEQLSTARGGDWWNHDNAPTIAQVGDVMAFATMRHGDPVNLPEYWSERRNSEIILSTTDGSSYERLTYNVGQDILPILSPDGSLLAFSSLREDRDPGVTIYMIKIDLEAYLSNPGTEPQLIHVTPSDLAVTHKYNRLLQWSHDGRFIAFYGSRPEDNLRGLFTVDVSTGDIHHIAGDLNWRPSVFAWSPVENRIALFKAEGHRHGTLDLLYGPIYTVGSDGSDRRDFDGASQFYNVKSIWWGPRGNEIRIFGTRHDGFGADGRGIRTPGLFSIFSDGTSSRLVAGMEELDYVGSFPPHSWSPDGSLIAFTTYSRHGHEGDVLRITDANLENERVLVTSLYDGKTGCNLADYKLIGADGKETIE